MSTRMCDVFQMDLNTRRYVYSAEKEKVAIAIDKTRGRKRSFLLFAENSQTAYEILYFYILSAFGEWLEKNNYQRLHACSFVRNGQAQLAYGDEGAGKSTLAISLHRGGIYSVINDEMAVINRRTLEVMSFSFPLSLKSSEDLEYCSLPKFSRFFYGKRFVFLERREFKSGYPLSGIFVLTGNPKRDLFCKVQVFLGIFLGRGLPQMTEYFVRANNIHWLFIFSVLRIRSAIRILFRIRIYNLPKTESAADRAKGICLKFQFDR